MRVDAAKTVPLANFPLTADKTFWIKFWVARQTVVTFPLVRGGLAA